MRKDPVTFRRVPAAGSGAATRGSAFQCSCPTGVVQDASKRLPQGIGGEGVKGRRAPAAGNGGTSQRSDAPDDEGRQNSLRLGFGQADVMEKFPVPRIADAANAPPSASPLAQASRRSRCRERRRTALTLQASQHMRIPRTNKHYPDHIAQMSPAGRKGLAVLRQPRNSWLRSRSSFKQPGRIW